MYLKKVHIENIGPVQELKVSLPFNEDGNPKPIVAVGTNGSGKSIVLSYIVNFIFYVQQKALQEAEIPGGKVFKVRSPRYISTGSEYGYSHLSFDHGMEYTEWLLRSDRKTYEEMKLSTPTYSSWQNIEESSNTHLEWPQDRRKFEAVYKNQVMLYFPPDRSEEPGWSSLKVLNSQAKLTDPLNFQGVSVRKVNCKSPLKDIRNWIFDVIVDIYTYDRAPVTTGSGVEAFSFQGKNVSTIKKLIEILKRILGLSEETVVQLGIGSKHDRSISIKVLENNISRELVPNLFQLSSGQIALLSIFGSILRDADFSGQSEKPMTEISGIVVIDEIDLHLHNNLNASVLPSLLKLFPKIQFIITSHSPIFILGMTEAYTSNEFKILELPSGNELQVEDFSEYQSVRDLIQIKESIKKASNQVRVLVEGPSDIIHLTNAWQKLRPGRTIPFDIVNGMCASHIKSLFSRDEIFKNNLSKTIGILDFDDAFDDWNSSKWQELSGRTEEVGLIKKHASYSGYFCLLPVPRVRNTFASRSLGGNSTLPIEFLYNDDVLSSNLCEVEVGQGAKLKKFTGNKVRFAELSRNFTDTDFKYFEPLLKMIEDIVTGTI